MRKKRILTKEHRRKIGESQKRVANSGRFKRGQVSPRKGAKLSEESKQKIGLANKGKVSWSKGKKLPNQSGRNHFLWGKQPSDETRRKMSEARKGCLPWNIGGILSDETRQKISKANKGKHNSKDTEFKKDSTPWNKGLRNCYSKETLKKILTRRIPTSLEEKFQTIASKNSLPYNYVGDGSFFIEKYNPDFINTNSKKIAIEVYARCFKLRHNKTIEEWKKGRSKIFVKYGWQIIYFDETEVTEKNVLNILGGK